MPLPTARASLLALVAATAGAACSARAVAAPAPLAPQVEEAEAAPALTIYNGNFAVVRQTVPLTLHAGTNDVSLAGMSALLEPDSVILRDPTGAVALSILEQNYRADPVTQGRLLALYEGQTIDFLVQRGDVEERVRGRIVRSGYVPVSPWQANPYGYTMPDSGQPIIEVDGMLRFSLPGLPLFPALADDTVLEPTLHWLLASDRDATLQAELGYVTGGLTWKADYNVVAPESGDLLDITGWITMSNECGKTFRNARLKLLAGDVNKIQPQDQGMYMDMKVARAGMAQEQAVTEKAFDEYHLYSVARPTTLHDRETKQVEMVRASGVPSTRLFVYDGAQLDAGWLSGDMRQYGDYGTQSTRKVRIVREFRNSAEHGLGVPLPGGRIRFYRQDAPEAGGAGGQLEFVGENIIDHTPKDEVVRVETGNAFDVVGERTRVNYRIDNEQKWIDESFEIVLRNHKTEPVEVRVVEHLYRWVNWDLTQHSAPFAKKDARTIEFTVAVPPDGEQKLTYTVHYSW